MQKRLARKALGAEIGKSAFFVIFSAKRVFGG
jgi:hypothetical protein